MPEFEWDETKATANRVKHGIDFADAATVFNDLDAVTIEDERADEQRFVSTGMDAKGRLLVVVYTWRGTHTVRMISARKANRTEQRQYEEPP